MNHTNHTGIPDTDYIDTDYIPETAIEATLEVSTKRTAEGTTQGTEGGAFDMDLTAGAVYDSLQERLALARTRALMGERVSALGLLRQAHVDYETYKDALQGFPLHALDHAFTVTMQTLCAEKMIESNDIKANEIEADKRVESGTCETPLAFASLNALSEPAERGVERKARSRKRATKAA